MPPKKRQRKSRTSDPEEVHGESASGSRQNTMVVDVQALAASLTVAVSNAVKDAMNCVNNPTSTMTSNETNVEELIDNHIQETIAGNVAPNMDQTTNKPTSRFESISVPLGSRVTSKIKAKIWAHEYVDFGALLATTPQNEKFSLSLTSGATASAEPKLTLEPAQPVKKVTTIHQWLTAFHTFTAIYTVKFPTATPQLMKYCEIVRDLAAKPGDWLFYDEQFRYLRQSGPDMYPWDGIHWELWLKAATNFRASKPTSYTAEKFGARTRSQNSFPRGTCWSFQSGRYCKGCQYEHVCFKCGGKHPGSQCSNTSAQHATRTRGGASIAPPTGNPGTSKKF